jgi:hypothetical protein
MSKGHAVLRFLRNVHLYVGIFTTPALLFFATTGAMQTFSLHETTQGSSYKPPAWIATLAQLHKKQTTAVPVRRARPTAPDGVPGNGQRGDRGDKGSRGAERKLDGAMASTGAAAPTDRSKAAGFARPESAPPAAPQKSHLPMKIFFLLVSVSLLLSTLTGIYMAYKYSRGWLVTAGLLAAGVIVPLLLLPF